MKKRPRLGVIQSHPIQYFSPLYREIAKANEIELKVLYCSRFGAESYQDVGFQRTIKWDTPLLEGYEFEFFPNWRKADTLGGFFSLINPGLIRELRRGHYDAVVIHGHNYFSYALGLLASRCFGIRVYMRCETHAGLDRGWAKRLLRKNFLQFLYTRVCYGGLAIGSRNALFYKENGMSEDRVILAPYSVDNRFFAEKSAAARAETQSVKARLGLPNHLFLFLYASKLTERKGCLDLLEAYRREKLANPGIGLVIVGTGELESVLKEKAKAETSDVFFLGFQNQTELPAIFGICDVFALPARNEPWGLIINEAMASGLPILACSGIGAVDDLLRPNENGLLLEAGNVEQIRQCLKRCAEDPEGSRRMGGKSKEIISKWGLAETRNGYERAAWGPGAPRAPVGA